MTVYVYPKFSHWDFLFFRLLGPGLGNLLLPWARAILFSKLYGVTLVEPTWPQLKIGTILRREKDLRTYYDLFKSSKSSIQGFHKILLLSSSKKLNEKQGQELMTSGLVDLDDKENKVIIFEGLGQLFKPLTQYHNLIYQELISIVKDTHLGGLATDFNNSISCHVRLGDFKLAGLNTPLGWYREAIEKLRNELGYCVDCNIFSDGTDEELQQLLDLPKTKRVCFGSSVSDLIALTRSRVLLCGPNSSFSQWALFMGRMPFILPFVNPIFNMPKELYKENGYIGQELNYSQSFLNKCEKSLLNVTQTGDLC